MVALVQSAERQVVALEVRGSNPLSHPTTQKTSDDDRWFLLIVIFGFSRKLFLRH